MEGYAGGKAGCGEGVGGVSPTTGSGGLWGIHHQKLWKKILNVFGEKKSKLGLGRISPGAAPTGGYGGLPPGIILKLTPIFCNLRYSEIIFVTSSKSIFLGNFGSKSRISLK